MKLRPELLAEALLDLAKDTPEHEIPALVDAAVAYLEEHRASRVIRMLPRLIREAWNKRGETQPVIIASPQGNLGDAREPLIKALERRTRKKVELTEQKNPELLGGASIIFSDERIDASVRGALDQLMTELLMPISS